MIYLRGNVPSLKNSKIKTAKGIFPSKTVTKYLRGLGIQSYSASRKEVKGYVNRPNLFAEAFEGFVVEKYPLIIGFHFFRASKHNFDFHNAVQIVADLMVAHGIIEDDSMDYFIPLPMNYMNRWYNYDKENPGVMIFTGDELNGIYNI